LAGPVTVLIRNKRGLHARASARFVTLASTFDAVVTHDPATISIWNVAWPIPKSCSSICAASHRNASPGCPAGQSRCAVNAVSVVLTGQMWTWWVCSTPGSAASRDRTASSSTPGGTP
jgi:hypothetical protein